MPDLSSLVLPDLRLRRISTDKERFFDLLLLADEEPAMIESYLERGTLYGLFWHKHTPVSLAVIVDVSAEFEAGTAGALEAPLLAGKRVCECKNIVTDPPFRGKGFAAQLLLRICGIYDQQYDCMIVGTGATPSLRCFYEEQCGFQEAFVRKGFFRKHYHRPVIWEGQVLEDMTYFIRWLDPENTPS